MQIDSVIPFGQQKKTQPTPTPSPTPTPAPAPTPTPSPTPEPSPAPAPSPTPQPSPAPAPSAVPSASSSPAPPVRITNMSDAVRQAVLDARLPETSERWLNITWEAPVVPLADDELARSRADIVKAASQALIAQANQTRESVISLLQAPG
mgnify:CR=1 FL=1